MGEEQDRTNSLSLVEDLLERFGGRIDDEPNQSTWKGRLPAGTIDLVRLKAFTAAGNRTVLGLSRGQWSATLTSAGRAAFDIRVNGTWEDAFEDDNQIDTGRAALEANDMESFLDVCVHLPAQAALTLIHDPIKSGFHWIRTQAALLRVLGGPEWLGATSQLLGTGKPREIVVEDAAANYVRCKGLLVRGPTAPSTSIGELDDRPEYRRAWLNGDQSSAPLPRAFLVNDKKGLADVAATMQGVCWALCWVWLSVEATIRKRGVVVRFEGFRPLQIELAPRADEEEAAEAVSVWEWAVSSLEPGQRESLQQAITLAVRSASDLHTTAGSVLRTARFLLRISQQRLVAEALATRRAARDAALQAVAEAGQAARESSRKAFDRVLIELGAVAGVVLANQQALFDRQTALVLLTTILILLGITSVGALMQEFPSIRGSFSAARLDLDEYREFLDEKEIASLRSLASMKEADRQIKASKEGAIRILLLAGLLTVLAGLWILCGGTDKSPKPTQSPTATSARGEVAAQTAG